MLSQFSFFYFLIFSYRFNLVESNECSDCGSSLNILKVWTDNSIIWRKEQFDTVQVNDCENNITCSRSEHLGGDLYIMFFTESPDIIGLKPFHMRRTLDYNLNEIITCRNGAWFFERYSEPITHILCDQFIIPKFRTTTAITTIPTLPPINTDEELPQETPTVPPEETKPTSQLPGYDDESIVSTNMKSNQVQKRRRQQHKMKKQVFSRKVKTTISPNIPSTTSSPKILRNKLKPV